MEDQSPLNPVPHRIAQVRRSRSMNQGDFGALVGISQTKISKIETLKQHVTLAELHAIADALKISPCDLIAYGKRPSEGAAFMASAFDRLTSEKDRRSLLNLARSLLDE